MAGGFVGVVPAFVDDSETYTPHVSSCHRDAREYVVRYYDNGKAFCNQEHT